MTTRKNFWWWVGDTVLLPTNTVGGVLNVVPNTLQWVRNSGNTAANVIKSMSSRIADAFTHKPFNYEKLDKFIAGDSFMKKRKTTRGNAWKWIKNTPRFLGNVIKQVWGWALATAVFVPAMVVWAPVGAAATLVKNTTQSVAGWVVDPMNSILKIWQQGPDDRWLAFTNVEKVNAISYTDYAKRITDNRARRKAKKAEKKAALKAIDAKYDWKTVAPAAPAPKPVVQVTPAPDTETSDGAKKK